METKPEYNYLILDAETREVVYRGLAKLGQLMRLPEHLPRDRDYLLAPREWERDPAEWESKHNFIGFGNDN